MVKARTVHISMFPLIMHHHYPSKSEVFGRCGGDEKNEWPRRTDKSRTLKKIKKIINMSYFQKLTFCLYFHQESSQNGTVKPDLVGVLINQINSGYNIVLPNFTRRHFIFHHYHLTKCPCFFLRLSSESTPQRREWEKISAQLESLQSSSCAEI